MNTIQSWTTIMSDCWEGYASLKDDPKYIHLAVCHRMNFADPETSVHIQTIKGTWLNSKMKNKSMIEI